MAADSTSQYRSMIEIIAGRVTEEEIGNENLDEGSTTERFAKERALEFFGKIVPNFLEDVRRQVQDERFETKITALQMTALNERLANEMASLFFAKIEQDVLEEASRLSQNNLQENKLQYGDLNEYGDRRHEVEDD